MLNGQRAFRYMSRVRTPEVLISSRKPPNGPKMTLEKSSFGEHKASSKKKRKKRRRFAPWAPCFSNAAATACRAPGSRPRSCRHVDGAVAVATDSSWAVLLLAMYTPTSTPMAASTVTPTADVSAENRPYAASPSTTALLSPSVSPSFPLLRVPIFFCKCLVCCDAGCVMSFSTPSWGGKWSGGELE
jgi:hypothetical protein